MSLAAALNVCRVYAILMQLAGRDSAREQDTRSGLTKTRLPAGPASRSLNTQTGFPGQAERQKWKVEDVVHMDLHLSPCMNEEGSDGHEYPSVTYLPPPRIISLSLPHQGARNATATLQMVPRVRPSNTISVWLI